MLVRARAVLAAGAALALLLTGCGGAGDGGAAGEQVAGHAGHTDEGDTDEHAGHDDEHVDESGDDHAAAESLVAPVPGADKVRVKAVDIDFVPARMELVAGEPVNVTVSNEGTTLHDFTLEAAGVHANVQPGGTATTSVTLDEPGSYQARCTVAGHAEAGMVIDVVVS